MPVRVRRMGDVAILEIDNPPVNALALPVRTALLAAIVASDEDPSVRALVLHGAGRNFIAGAQIEEFDAPRLPPIHPRVVVRLEQCTKPVIAALHGHTLGGGFEIALAAHYRCATRDVRVGLPEINLGLFPGGGAPLRLPRLIGLEAALAMMLDARSIGIDRALELGIVDRVLEGTNVLEAALAWARELIDARAPVRRVRALPWPAPPPAGFFAQRRAEVASSHPGVEAPACMLELLEAAPALDIEAEVELSERLFNRCRTSNASRALRRLFFAERGSAPGTGATSNAPARRIARAQIVGLGPAARAARSLLEKAGVEIAPDAATSAAGGSTASVDLLVVEASEDRPGAAAERLRALEDRFPAGTLIALLGPAAELAAAAARAQRGADVFGLHFAGPLQSPRAIEIVRTHATGAASIAAAFTLCRRAGMLAIVTAGGAQFVADRLCSAWQGAGGSGAGDDMRAIDARGSAALAEEGARLIASGAAASARDIDALCCNAFGFPRWMGGPMFAAGQA
jgi:3-hydroxyacyl-CoA dehydrogenase